VATPALAEKKTAATVICSVKEEGQSAPTELPAARIKRIATPVTCSLRVTAAPTDGDGVHASIQTFRKVKDPKTGKASAVEGPEHFEVAVPVGADAKPLTVALKRLNDKGVGDFEACRDFDIVALVHDDYSKVLWKKTLTIKQPCPKPAPIDFTVSCSATGADGKPFDLPDKTNRRLANADVECRLESQGQRLGTSYATAQTSWTTGNGATETKHQSAPLNVELTTLAPHVDADQIPPDSAYASAGTFILSPMKHFDTCVPLTSLLVTVADEDGQLISQKSLPIKQNCPKPPALNAKLRCSMRFSSGDEVTLPDTHQTRLSGDSIACSLTSGDGRLLSAEVSYQTAWDNFDSGAKTPKNSTVYHAETGIVEGVNFVRRFTLGHENYEECSAPLALSVKAADKEGHSLFESTLKLKQKCLD